MVGAKALIEKQQVYIQVDQAVTPEEMDTLIAAIEVEAAALKPGWTAALDMRGIWVNSPYFYEEIKNLQQAIIRCGASRIGTIIDNYVIKILLGQAGLRTNANVIAQRFYDEKEWLNFLDSAPDGAVIQASAGE